MEAPASNNIHPMNDEQFLLTYVSFNILEGVFWIALAIVSFIAGNRHLEYRSLSIFTGTNLILFGISDLIEAKFGSFFETTMEWLFLWKGLCVAGLIASVLWYLRKRTRGAS